MTDQDSPTHHTAGDSTMTSNPSGFIDDESRGLIILLDKVGFCASLVDQSDNNRTAKPRNLGKRNETSMNIINALDELPVADAFDHLVKLYSTTHQTLPPPSQLFPKWRNLNDRLTAAYLHRALVKRADQNNLKPHDISIRLSPTFARRILAEGGAPYLLERLRKQLNRVLNRTPDAWIILEATVGDGTASDKEIRQGRKSPVSRHRGLLHFHGAISLNRSEVQLFEHAVTCLNASDNADFNKHESTIRLMEPGKGDGWVEYVTKYPMLNRGLLPGITRLSKTRSITSLAETLYNADRDSYRQKYRQM